LVYARRQVPVPGRQPYANTDTYSYSNGDSNCNSDSYAGAYASGTKSAKGY